MLHIKMQHTAEKMRSMRSKESVTTCFKKLPLLLIKPILKTVFLLILVLRTFEKFPGELNRCYSEHARPNKYRAINKILDECFSGLIIKLARS